MISTAFEKNILKKVLWFFLFISIITLVGFHQPLISFFAFTLGTLTGSARLLVMGKFFSGVLKKREDKNPLENVIYILAFALFYGLLLFSVVFGLRFFIFFASGFALMNFVIFVNSILEVIGISTNTFIEEGDREHE